MRTKTWISIILLWLLSAVIFSFIFYRAISETTSEFACRLLAQEVLNLNETLAQQLEKPKANPAIVKEAIKDYAIGNNGYAFLMDKNGNYLAYSARQRVLNPLLVSTDKKDLIPLLRAKPAGDIGTIGTSIKSRAYAYTNLKNTPWILVLIYPYYDMVIASLARHSLLWLNALLTFLLIILLIGMLIKHELKPFNWMKLYLNSLARRQAISIIPETLRDAQLTADLLSLQQALVQDNKTLQLNPLTGLPGYGIVQQEIFERIDSKAQFAVVFVNCKFYSGYNHKYGFKKGDAVIRFIAFLLKDKLQESGNRSDILAHIGGDHFVFITSVDAVDSVCAAIIKTFDEQIPSYYDEEDRKRGFIISKDRTGNIQKFPIMQITLAAATNASKPLIHPLQVDHIVAEISDFLKTLDHSAYLKDRRIIEREEDETVTENAES